MPMNLIVKKMAYKLSISTGVSFDVMITIAMSKH